MSSEIQQAVILAGGESSRFTPFQRGRHKSTFSIFGQPIISQTIQKLEETGVLKIEIIKSINDSVIEELVHNLDLKADVRFHDQKEPLGMANALLETDDDLEDRFLLINAQQLNVSDHLDLLKDDKGVVLFSQETDIPQKYGMLAFHNGQVSRVVEKPKDLSGLSNQRVLGIYVLTRHFVDFLKNTKTSEYQFEEALDEYVQMNRIVAKESSSQALSLKYVWDIFAIAHYKFNTFASDPVIHPGANIHSTALIKGPVIIEKGANIHEYSVIQGPCYIGKDAVVGSFCKVRKESILEEGVELQNQVEVKHSIIGKNTHIHSGFIGDSIIGEDVRIGAGFDTANRRLDRKRVKVSIKGSLVDTGSTFFGSLIGDRTKIGIHCGTNPGVIISEDSVVFPGTILSNNKDSN